MEILNVCKSNDTASLDVYRPVLSHSLEALNEKAPVIILVITRNKLFTFVQVVIFEHLAYKKLYGHL